MREIKFRAYFPNENMMGLVIHLHGTNKDYQFDKVTAECFTNGRQQFYCGYNSILMQFTGLKDKKGSGNICFYEGDIIDLHGNLLGNKYQNEQILKEKTNLLIKGLGTKNWRATEKEALDRGLGYAE